MHSKSEVADIFNTLDEIFLVFTDKSKFSLSFFFIFFRRGKSLTFCLSIILLSSVHLVGVENGL